ncbi:MAG: hypothetical protein WC479_00665 [Candidatus Izemoplasmatales bacterium]
MAKNQPWKSKTLMIMACASIGATLEPERRTDPKGNRVYVIQYKGEIIGCRTMIDVYIWLTKKLKPDKFRRKQ